ncbi:hypothetical protein V5799_034182 [Amblyomma americanum]|uniref:M13 family peptidase n=1 Tax=Amblyomma americanum TaxID=6943 RepID=A0AAQ4DL68_AMBAM
MPKVYDEVRAPDRQATAELLKAWQASFFTCSEGSDESEHQYLDVGCGPGNFVRNHLLPLCPPALKRLVATDNSKAMIDYAKRVHAHPKVEHRLLDIAIDDEVTDFIAKEGCFQRVYSFLALHWIEDKCAALRNIERLLTPGGECLVIFNPYPGPAQLYQALLDSDSWAKYRDPPVPPASRTFAFRTPSSTLPPGQASNNVAGSDNAPPNEKPGAPQRRQSKLAPYNQRLKDKEPATSHEWSTTTGIPRKDRVGSGVFPGLFSTTGVSTLNTTAAVNTDRRGSRRNTRQSIQLPASHFLPAVEPRQPCSGAPKSLIVVSALAFGFFAILLVRMYWIPTPSKNNVCTTHECLAYSRHLLQSINADVDPCESFTRFVCHGWEKKHLFSVRETHFANVVRKVTESADALSDNYTIRGQNEAQRAATLYLSCHDILRGASNQLALVKEALATAGITWPEVRRGEVNLPHTLLYSSLKLGWGTVLDFSVVRYPLEDVLIVRPGASFPFVIDKTRGFSSNKTRDEYFQELAQSFGGNATAAATVSYEEMASIEAVTLNKLVPSYNSLIAERSASSLAMDIVNASEFGLSEESWLSVLGSLNVRLPNGLNLTSTRPDYVKEVFSLWTTLGEETLHLLVSWCTVQVAALYANEQLVANYYGKSSKRAQIYHGAFCISRAMVLNAQALFSSYIAGIQHSGDTLDARETALSVREAFRKRLTNWEHHASNVTVVVNWTSQEVLFRSFSAPEDTTGHKERPDMTPSLVRNWQLLAAQGLTSEDVGGVLHSVSVLRYYVLSRPEYDFYLLPYALSYPTFDIGLTAALNYGGLGVIIGHALGRLLIAAYRSDPESAPAIDAAMDCLRNGSFVDVSRSAAFDAAAFGVGALMDAYASTSAFDNAVVGLEQYSTTQLLFIALCHNRCEGGLKGNADSHCNRLLQYVPEFSTAFGCSPGTPMNPHRQCKFL